VWAEPLEGWNCEAALLSRHAEYLLCGLTRKRYSTCLGFFTCTRTARGGPSRPQQQGLPGSLCGGRVSRHRVAGAPG